jgi:4-amino-4-deoxy-L-arabinose transferase-like glycosyltransferase
MKILSIKSIKSWIIKNKLPIGLFLCALAIRLIFFGINFTHNDFNLLNTIHGQDGYYEISQNLLQGHGFSFDTTPPYHPEPLRPPVWPVLIAFFAKIFGSYWASFMFEIILGSAIPVLGMYLARYIIPEPYVRSGSVWVAILLILDPYSILLSFIFYTETCFTFFLLLFFLFLFRYLKEQTMRNAAWASVFLALATLVKPTTQYFVVLIPLALLFIFRKKWSWNLGRQLGAFVAIFVLLISPWLYWNHQTFGVWGTSAQPAFNLYVYLVPTVLSIDNHTNFQTEYNNFLGKNNPGLDTITLANSPYYQHVALGIIMQHKKALVESGVISFVTFFTHDGMLTFLEYSGVTINNILTKPAISMIGHPSELISLIAHYADSPAILVFIFRIIWILISLLFLTGIYFYIKKEGWKSYGVLAVLIIAYFTLTTMINGLGVNARFRVPVEALIFIFAVYGFCVIKERIFKITAHL